LAWAAWNLKDYDQVQRWVQESMQEGFEPWWYLLGRLALSRGDYTYARVCLEKYKSFGTGENAKAIQALGILAAVQQQERRAVVLFGALEQRCGWLKNVSSPTERDEYEQALAAVRAALGEEDFQAAWAEGHEMDLEQAAAWLVSGMQVDGE
jgi:tetratricopeptide (TPR) repeat protein